MRPVAGASDAATAGVEYVQRLTRRFRYDDLPWQEAQRAGLLWSPIRKPHENAADEHWLSRGTFADVPHPELDATLRYPVSKWISTRGSWTAGRRTVSYQFANQKPGKAGEAHGAFVAQSSGWYRWRWNNPTGDTITIHLQLGGYYEPPVVPSASMPYDR